MNALRCSVLAAALVASIAVAFGGAPPAQAALGEGPAPVAQYPAWYGYGSWPWGDYYPGSGLAAWRNAYVAYSAGGTAYAVYPGYAAYSAYPWGYYGYPWYDASYPLTPALSYSPYYGVVVYPGSGLYTTPNGTSFVVCPSYALYC
jgi:hypothetical protein